MASVGHTIHSVDTKLLRELYEKGDEYRDKLHKLHSNVLDECSLYPDEAERLTEDAVKLYSRFLWDWEELDLFLKGVVYVVENKREEVDIERIIDYGRGKYPTKAGQKNRGYIFESAGLIKTYVELKNIKITQKSWKELFGGSGPDLGQFDGQCTQYAALALREKAGIDIFTLFGNKKRYDLDDKLKKLGDDQTEDKIFNLNDRVKKIKEFETNFSNTIGRDRDIYGSAAWSHAKFWDDYAEYHALEQEIRIALGEEVGNDIYHPEVSTVPKKGSIAVWENDCYDDHENPIPNLETCYGHVAYVEDVKYANGKLVAIVISDGNYKGPWSVRNDKKIKIDDKATYDKKRERYHNNGWPGKFISFQKYIKGRS